MARLEPMEREIKESTEALFIQVTRKEKPALRLLSGPILGGSSALLVGYYYFPRGWQRISLALFALLAYFWAIKLAYCVHGYLTNGTVGVRNAIIHGAVVPQDPLQWGTPRWGLIALQYSVIALITFLLGLTNRGTLKRFWSAVSRHTPPKPDS